MKRHLKKLNNKIIALIAIISIVILSLGSYMVYGTTYSLGTNVEATIDISTGELTIESTSGVGIINNSIYSVFGDNVASNIKKVTFNNTVEMESNLQSLFRDMKNLESISNINYLDTSNVKYMNGMFSGCSSLTSLNLSTFDTSNVTNMKWMFEDCSR